jgi:hypothetical protein
MTGNKFYKGRTNNHLSWVMVDSTDFATPESALSAAMKIKIYGKTKGATGVNTVSSGTGSLTNDIQHVGPSVTGVYTIALAKADLSDASAAWYDHYVITLSATGAAYQTLIVDGGINDSYISDVLSYVSNMESNLSGVVSDIRSNVSDLQSDFQSRVPKRVATDSQLSDLHSDLKSFLTVMSGVQSDLYSAVSDMQSDFQSRVPKRVATDSQLSDLHSDLRSFVNVMSGILSDTYSAVILTQSLASDAHSAAVVAQGLNASDLSDIRSAITAVTATVGASDISDIASAVRATLVSDLSDILSAAAQANSRVLLVQSRLSDLDSRLVSDVSDIMSMLTANSDILSNAYSAAAVGSSRILLVQSRLSDLDSRLVSDLSDILSAAQQTNSRALVIQSMASDAHSMATLAASYASDTYSAVTSNRTEPAQGAPGVSISTLAKIDWLYKAFRNKSTQTATEYDLFADDATTVDHKATVSDDGTTFTRGEIASGSAARVVSFYSCHLRAAWNQAN